MLQADDIGGQTIDLLLRFIDRRQSRHYVGKSFVGFLEAFVKALIHLATDFGKTRVIGFGQRFDRGGNAQGDIAHHQLNGFLLGAGLFREFFQSNAQHFRFERILLFAELQIEDGKLLNQRFPARRQGMGLFQLQGLQRLPRFAQFIAHCPTQSLSGVKLAGGNAIRLPGKTVSKICEHCAMAILLLCLQAGRYPGNLALEGEAEPDHDHDEQNRRNQHQQHQGLDIHRTQVSFIKCGLSARSSASHRQAAKVGRQEP